MDTRAGGERGEVCRGGILRTRITEEEAGETGRQTDRHTKKLRGAALVRTLILVFIRNISDSFQFCSE